VLPLRKILPPGASASDSAIALIVGLDIMAIRRPIILEGKHMSVKYVITDPARSAEDMPGFAMDSPIEGWIFTWLLSAATRFSTEQEAEEAIKRHYPGDKGKGLLVRPVSK
jgi:hypothetical protein